MKKKDCIENCHNQDEVLKLRANVHKLNNTITKHNIEIQSLQDLLHEIHDAAKGHLPIKTFWVVVTAIISLMTGLAGFNTTMYYKSNEELKEITRQLTAELKELNVQASETAAQVRGLTIESNWIKEILSNAQIE